MGNFELDAVASLEKAIALAECPKRPVTDKDRWYGQLCNALVVAAERGVPVKLVRAKFTGESPAMFVARSDEYNVSSIPNENAAQSVWAVLEKVRALTKAKLGG